MTNATFHRQLLLSSVTPTRPKHHRHSDTPLLIILSIAAALSLGYGIHQHSAEYAAAFRSYGTYLENSPAPWPFSMLKTPRFDRLFSKRMAPQPY